MINEEDAIEMIDLMLENDGKPFICCYFPGCPILILIGDGDFFEALNLGYYFRNAQAAFFVNLTAFMADNFRVYHPESAVLPS